ncbi:hypothetical protein A3D00_04305 [Candidatus Woesebacteria bacterium RIFCSPHIGHO2_02_FULL_38_9]|uniref:Uncharacterized protein n=1 Tax=Candidatus Woesebacteria bacterium RIFCSPHIGHO2_01_FULL_39_28 TaxID=1802496 RepID=A0A1F7YCZ8_9BACT|nr:MAG: hypothetical protein A2627_00180 [Candidatus Woesebacteria bacterium RIFCSPHIGHO2_01_FULL_39_28]OGM32391.1 MAG: hypothetical protein A3D00_04305 [Candidatus Woesebacteria bacterium RIFCSPHIGHO2_02_FULL_38_9]OGM57888.1 MAG: hypothetical protein A3A50_04610 [Candidatus Woesebacteria bacterium RIFCSPLOWO2_01_FULL_38_20]
MKNLISPNLRLLFFPVFSILVLLFLTVFVTRLFFGKIGELRARISELAKEENSVKEKILVLESEQSFYSPFSEKVSVAFPPKNPAILVVGQIKKEANLLGLNIDNFKVGGEVQKEGGLYSVQIGFDLAGSPVQELNFLQSVPHIAPISKIDSFRISKLQTKVGENPISSILLSSYWSPFPENLPPITESIGQLSNEDKSIISSLSALNPPGVSQTSPQPPLERLDPFKL